MGKVLEKRFTLLTPSSYSRMFWSVLFQKRSMRQVGLNKVGPYDLTGKTFLVTGGNGGIGYETVKNLLKWNGNVIIGCRRENAANEAITKLKTELKNNELPVSFVKLDLADLKSIKNAVIELKQKDQTVDVLDLNAGMSPRKYETTEQGVEISYASNVLGNYALVQGLIDNNVLANNGRVVVVTGDIYVAAKDSTPDLKYKNNNSAFNDAYSRSKLGLNWVTFEFQRRYPQYNFVLVHPGVFVSGLMDISKNMGSIFIQPEDGCKTPLFCCSAPDSLVVNVGKEHADGGYYHNVFGLVKFSRNDVAVNPKRAQETFELCEKFANMAT